MMALSAAGRRAATCSALKPPHDLPIMPSAPLHQGWRAIQAITSSASSCSSARYSSAIEPSESPEPRMWTGTAGEAGAGEETRLGGAPKGGGGGWGGWGGGVGFEIGNVVENRGRRPRGRIGGQPDAGGEPGAVLQVYPDVLDHVLVLHGAWFLSQRGVMVVGAPVHGPASPCASLAPRTKAARCRGALAR